LLSDFVFLNLYTIKTRNIITQEKTYEY